MCLNCAFHYVVSSCMHSLHTYNVMDNSIIAPDNINNINCCCLVSGDTRKSRFKNLPIGLGLRFQPPVCVTGCYAFIFFIMLLSEGYYEMPVFIKVLMPLECIYQCLSRLVCLYAMLSFVWFSHLAFSVCRLVFVWLYKYACLVFKCLGPIGRSLGQNECALPSPCLLSMNSWICVDSAHLDLWVLPDFSVTGLSSAYPCISCRGALHVCWCATCIIIVHARV